jgi:hydrogenase maturation protein HypF
MERRAVLVQGIVQGVGFRPFVHNLALRLQLTGFVKNRTGSVWIEVEGEPSSLNDFLAELTRRPPTLARIDRLTWQSCSVRGERDFQIHHSDADALGPIFISPDVAVCPECLAEMLDPNNRRHGYPFLNCTNCGPRLTIITGSPYDRQRTTMASFSMCSACRAEYENPRDRRFHAQPTACAACGPRLELRGANGESIVTANPLAEFIASIRCGLIGAMKGLGGYHLCCDARKVNAVAELRRRKHRDEKPFAIMVQDLAGAESLCQVGDTERELLLSLGRPIVLLRKREACAIAEAVAPGNSCLGIMLPYTPLHHLLLRAADIPLVMTSGNRSDEPIAYLDDDALQRLTGIADRFLIHDRPIQVRCDDSVTRAVDGLELPVRRSRGYAPRPIALPVECPCPILATGGQLKVAFALGRHRQAFLSHHLGDLDYYEAYQAFARDINLYERLFDIRPEYLVHDLHPAYASTRYAQERAAQMGIPVLSAQHHHAHLASCLAENGVLEAAIGVTFDGTGYGMDGAIWGGEFLVGDCDQFRRAAHLRYVGMPGGDQAIREPWRMALSYLADAEIPYAACKARILPGQVQTVERLLERRFRTPLTSSAGRLFDAVASLAGVADRVSFEGQAAVRLEGLASRVAPSGAYPFAVEETGGIDPAQPLYVIDSRPIIRAVVQDARCQVDAEVIARRFHSTLVEVTADICWRLREKTGLSMVALSGGVFLNALLTSEVSARLRKDGFRVCRHRLVPPNDGGLSLGQLAIAAVRLKKNRSIGEMDVSWHSRQSAGNVP